LTILPVRTSSPVQMISMRMLSSRCILVLVTAAEAGEEILSSFPLVSPAKAGVYRSAA